MLTSKYSKKYKNNINNFKQDNYDNNNSKIIIDAIQ